MVPEALGGDLQFVVDGDKVYAEPVGKAKLYLVTKHDPSVEPKKAGKFVMGDKFEAKYFTGTYRLHDDGRRSGKLVLEVDEDGKTVTGAYYSDKDGQKYDVTRQGRHADARDRVHRQVPAHRAGVQGHAVHRQRQGDGRHVAPGRARPRSTRRARSKILDASVATSSPFP